MSNTQYNAAYTGAYRKQHSAINVLFEATYQSNFREVVLSNGYKLIETDYCGELEGSNYSVSFCRLLGLGNEVVCEWKCYDNSARFYEVISHSNGCEYLIFRQDLYGYSVMSFADFSIFQYFPKSVMDGREDFIWTSVHYNPINNMLAVEGCYWACPNGVLLVCFATPMESIAGQVDVLQQIDGGYDTLDDAEFIRWDAKDLILSCYDVNLEVNQELKILESSYLSWL